MSKKDVTCCGLQLYFVEIKPKKDSGLSTDQVSEFFYHMSLNHEKPMNPVVVSDKSDVIRVAVVGLSLHEMIEHIESCIYSTGYIYSVQIGPEVVVYDYVRK